jgi:hypothetical protein
MTRTLIVAGYVALAVGAVVVEVVARRSDRVATFPAALSVLLRRAPFRVAAQLAWLWLGWHLFVRVEWR